MYAYSNILSALLIRGRTGRGCRIDVSMLESMVEWMGYPLYYAIDGAVAARAVRRGARDDLSVWAVPRWRRQDCDARSAKRARMEALLRARAACSRNSPSDERFTSNSKRTSARDALREVIVAAFAKLSAAQVIGRLDRARHRQRADEHARRCVGASATEGARALAWKSARRRARCPRCCHQVCRPDFEPRMDPVPALGEHTEAILRELGYDSARIDALRAAGTI